MKTIALVSALALGAMTAGAMAEPVVPMNGATARQSGPVELTDVQMDKISAGSGNSDVAGYGWQGTASSINDVVNDAGGVGYNNADDRGGLGQKGNIPGGISGPGYGRTTAGH
jgi:hypothetical protein